MPLSAPLLSRKRVIKVLAETTKGTKIAATSAVLVYDLEINPTAPYEERKGTGLYRGHSYPGTTGARSGKCTFKCELRAGAAHTLDAGVAILLQACGLKKATEVYQVHSGHTDDTTISIDVWEDGIKKGLAGASGNVTLEGEKGGRVMLNFDFDGVWQVPTAEAMPTWTPGTTAPMKFQGGTFTLATLAIKISKFSLNLGGQVVARWDAAATGGIAYYMITDYDPVVSIDPEADLVAGYDFNGIWLAGTEAAIVLAVNDGTDKATITLPKVVCKELKGGDRDGIQIYDVTGQCDHSNSGNDAVAIAIAAV